MEHEDKHDDDSVGGDSSLGQSGRFVHDEEALNENGQRDVFIEKEEMNVRRAKYTVITALVACAAAVGISVYFFAKQNDEHNFDIEYEGYAERLVELTKWEVAYNFALMEQLSSSISATTNLTKKTTFPYTTVPAFEISAGYVDGMGGIMVTALSPLVKGEEQKHWEEYSMENQEWLKESEYLREVHPHHTNALYGTYQDHEQDRRRLAPEPSLISPEVWRWENEMKVPDTTSPGELLAPLWQISPASAPTVNVNLFSDRVVTETYNAMVKTRTSVMSPAVQIGDLFDFAFGDDEKDRKDHPHMYLMEPVFSGVSHDDTEIVALLIAMSSFGNLLDRILPEGANGILAVIKDSCGNIASYEINGQNSSFLGFGDLHDPSFDNKERTSKLEQYEEVVDGLCQHTLHIYPSESFRGSYDTNKPLVYTIIVAIAFAVTATLLVAYDITVSQRQDKTMKTALRSNAVISSLFPEAVRARVLGDTGAGSKKGDKNKGTEKYLGGHDTSETRSIADFYPSVTVLFADIAGFTAWSSTREPFQVFSLLETVYADFDRIAKRRGVFKVETIGDCYVAVTGLPMPRADHATAMARFARECHEAFREISYKLQISLGPDTGDLALRMGMHSGAVTAGVLRGDNARFQLFGDTMNTAARMEGTGVRDRIQISQETADILIAANKKHWIKPREDMVEAKGKGKLHTWWLNSGKSSDDATSARSETSEDSTWQPETTTNGAGSANQKQWNATTTRLQMSKRDRRLVEWNASLLQDRLKKLLEQRNKRSDLSKVVQTQTLDFVTEIAAGYNNNHFHSFEHASHVTMSVSKLLARVDKPDEQETSRSAESKSYVKDISSCALTQFAVVFAAIIHDLDHRGVPNATLVEEVDPLAVRYRSTSVAEHNSMDLAWSIFTKGSYDDLRACVGVTENDMEQFHLLLENIVLATDICDRDLKAARDARWNAVFSESASSNPSIDHDRATIVLEHLIQASDVCHTMQHWKVFLKWNERLFCEMYKTYKDGRSRTNPADVWYEGEMGFFDFYVIPVARKLKECGVFGVSSDEYLNYAMENRKEWEAKGQAVVAEMVEKYCDKESRPVDIAARPSPQVPEENEDLNGLARRVRDRLRK